MRNLCSLIIVVLMLSVGTIVADEPAEFFQLVCEPVNVAMPPGMEKSLSAPNLSVVNTKIKPKYTRLLLDGRPIGRARDFDGDPGPLFLRPGRYRIEAIFGGYQTTVFEVDARPNCLFRIKHQMSRISGTAKESKKAYPELKNVSDDIYGPIVAPVPGAMPDVRSKAWPELTIRANDIPSLKGGTTSEESAGGCLIFDVRPEIAAVYINGAFVASVAELKRMEKPLAVNAGEYLVEIIAPGYEAAERRMTILPGQEQKVDLDLKAVPPSP